MQLQVPDSFYKEEELCGYLVTTETKHLWGVQLGCLQELKRICEKHDIHYFASGGTLLGAVRHRGFIPWDDDIDIMMFYDDYVTFCEVAPKEIEHPYFFQNFKTEQGFGPAFSRIRNTDTTGCTRYDYAMADGRYNCGIFIDIFPLFGIEDRLIPSVMQRIGISIFRSAISGYETKRVATLKGWTWKKRLNPNVLWWNILSLFTNHVCLSKCYLRACSSVKSFKKVALLSFTGFDTRLTWNREWFDEMTTMPFEFTDIICPKEYDSVLRTQYGDYMKYVRGGQIHTMVLFDPYKPFNEVLQTHIGR